MIVPSLLGAAALIAVVKMGVSLVRADPSHVAHTRTALKRPVTWVVGTPIVVVVAILGAAFVYVHAFEADPPPPLSFADLGFGPTTARTTAVATGGTATSESSTTSTVVGAPVAKAAATLAAVGGEVDGPWTVGKGSEAGYNIKDTVFGMTTTVVGRTPDVSGAFTIVNAGVATARVVVNMQTVTCGCMHDSKYHEMLETDKYPTSEFDLTRSIALSAIPPDGQVVNIAVVGNFTIHGVTHEESLTLAAVRQSGRIAINAKFPIKLEDYKISGGSNAAGSVHDPFIEFLVAFDRS